MKNYILITTLLLPSFILANTTVANITALKGKTEIVFKEEIKLAKLKDALTKENSVITHKEGFAQLMFKDETIVSIGKNSKFSVEEYLGEETSEPEVRFNLAKGAMRVITGRIGKINPKRFKIKTKSATIGIRGTNFVVISLPGKADIVLCTQGGVNVNGTFVKKGFMARLDKNGKVEGVKEFNSDDLDVVLDTIFKKETSKSLETEELVAFFDNKFDDDPSNDEMKKDDSEEEEEKDEEPGEVKIYLSEDETVETDNISVIPLEDTIVLDEKEPETIDNIENAVKDTTQEEAQEKVIVEVEDKPLTYLYGTGNTATIVEGTSLVNYYNKLGFSLSIDPNTETFLQDSLAIDTKSSKFFTFDSELSSYTSDYEFAGTFTQRTYDLDGNYTVKDGSYIRTIPDLDANDDVTWGEWLIPIEIEDADSTSTINEVWRGNFIAGKLTDTSVISGYAQANLKGTYSGPLIGQAFELDSGVVSATSFTGTSVSTVSFGQGTVDTNLNFSVSNTNYNETLNNTITGNKFSGLNSSGAFYGAEGKTLGGEFNINDSTNKRQLTGAFQGKTNLLTNE